MFQSKKSFRLISFIFSAFIVVGIVILTLWNIFLGGEIKKSEEERDNLKRNMEKIEILEKVGRNVIKDVLRQKAIALCFWELIDEYEKKYSRKEKQDCVQLIVMADEKYGNKGIDAPVILAWLEKESSGNPDAFSPEGAKGLTQWMDYRAWKILNTMGYPGYDEKLIFDPVVNLAGGLYYLNSLANFWEWKGIEDKNRILYYTLHSYKWGPERTEELYNNDGKASRDERQYIDETLKRREYWEKKLKYWITDAQKLAYKLEKRGTGE